MQLPLGVSGDLLRRALHVKWMAQTWRLFGAPHPAPSPDPGSPTEMLKNTVRLSARAAVVLSFGEHGIFTGNNGRARVESAEACYKFCRCQLWVETPKIGRRLASLGRLSSRAVPLAFFGTKLSPTLTGGYRHTLGGEAPL